jgi:argininosuccinate synthase
VPAKQKSYTINENLLGVTMSGGEIDRWEAPGRAHAAGARRARVAVGAAARRDRVRAAAWRWRSTGRPWPVPALLERLNREFARYGVGRGVYTGDTTIGLKGRIVFEAPGLTALHVAHRALEEAV